MYIGQIFPLLIGKGGLVGTRDQQEIDPDKLIISRNTSYEGGILSREGGATKYNSTVIGGAPTVLGGWDWWPNTTTQRAVVVLSDGTIKKDSGAGTFATTLASALTVTDVVPVFVEGGKEGAALNRKLFIFTGKNAVQVLSADGATTSAIATPPADWSGVNQPSFGFVHEGRLWAGGNLNDPHRLYYSTTGSHEDFTGAGSGTLSIYPGEGEKLVGAISFKGLIIAWKFPVGIYIVDTTDPTIVNWKVKRLSQSVGGVSPLGMVAVDNDIVFIDHALNFHLLSAVQEFGDAASSNLSRKFKVYQFVQDNMALNRAAFVRGTYYAAKREAHFAMSQKSSTINDARFVIDFNEEGTIRFRYSDRDVCESLWLRKDSNNINRLASGDNAGFVWAMDQTNKNKDNAGYASDWQTPFMDLHQFDPKLATVRKIGQYLEIVSTPVGNFNLNVDIFWDDVFVHTTTFNMGTAGAALGTFTLGTHALGGGVVVTRKRRILGSGRRISIAGHVSGVNEDYAIGSMYLHALISDERPGRSN